MSHDRDEEEQPIVDVEDHERTFNGFLRVAALVGIVSVAILIFLAIVGT